MGYARRLQVVYCSLFPDPRRYYLCITGEYYGTVNLGLKPLKVLDIWDPETDLI